MPTKNIERRVKEREAKKQQRAQKKENKKYLGFIPAKYVTPGTILAGLVALGGIVGVAMQIRQHSNTTGVQDNPRAKPLPKPQDTNLLSVKGVHNSTLTGTRLPQNVSASVVSSEAVSPMVQFGTAFKSVHQHDVTQNIISLQQARINEIRNHYPKDIIEALGGAEAMAKYPMRVGNPETAGYNIDPRTITDPITLSKTIDPHNGDTKYFVTLQYNSTNTISGETSIETETFASFGSSGGVKLISGSEISSFRPRVMRDLRYTPRDLDYIRLLRSGETVKHRSGSFWYSKSKIAKGEMPIYPGDNVPLLKRQMEECIEQTAGEYCNLDEYAADSIAGNLAIRLTSR